jgi:hypothetical protein
MMIISDYESQQDTLRVIKIVINESIRIKTYSLPEIRQLPSKDSAKHTRPSAQTSFNNALTDTTSVCTRNSIADVTFYDSNNLITMIKPGIGNRFLFIYTENNRLRNAEAKATLVKHLNPGQNIPLQPLHSDWIILIILISAFLYSYIRTTSKSLFPWIMRFFLFRGINDHSSRDVAGLFNWQSTILNFVSFLVVGLFGYCFAISYDIIPAGISGIKGYLIFFGIIVTAVTLRHITCLITGNMSGERDVFREYVIGVYQSYRISAMILLVIVVLLSYTILMPVKVYFTAGIIAFFIIYSIRVVRLLIIFINRKLSIFYLILYLCALEILPVGITVKYFTGLF